MSEGFIAQFAGERSLPVMRTPSVHLETVRRREHLFAFYTGIDVSQRHHTGPHQQVVMVRMETARRRTRAPRTAHKLVP